MEGLEGEEVEGCRPGISVDPELLEALDTNPREAKAGREWGFPSRLRRPGRPGAGQPLVPWSDCLPGCPASDGLQLDYPTPAGACLWLAPACPLPPFSGLAELPEFPVIAVI